MKSCLSTHNTPNLQDLFLPANIKMKAKYHIHNIHEPSSGHVSRPNIAFIDFHKSVAHQHPPKTLGCEIEEG